MKLKEGAMKIINHEEKEMIPLTYEERNLIKNKEHAIYVTKTFVWIKMMKIIKIGKKLKIKAIIQENLEELLIANATLIIKFQKIFQ